MTTADSEQDAVLLDLQERIAGFQRRLVRVVGLTVVIAESVAGIPLLYLAPTARTGVALVMIFVGSVAAFFLPGRGRTIEGARALLYGLFLGLSVAVFGGIDDVLGVCAINAMFILVALAPLLLSLRESSVLSIAGALVVIGSHMWAAWMHPDQAAELNTKGIVQVSELACVILAVSVFAEHARNNQVILADRLRDIGAVIRQARRIAEGDLSADLEGESEISNVLRAMLRGLRSLVLQIKETASRLDSSTAELAATAQQLQRGAVEQSTAVVETQQTLNALVRAAGDIAESGRDMAMRADSTLATNQQTAQRMKGLATQTVRVAEVLELIKEIANKSELLALNAALEGAKAGEAGRGFSLVATQMQRLAENVMHSVSDIKRLTQSISDATRDTASSSESATKVASEASETARRISATAQQQRSGTEQAAAAMDDIQQVTVQVTEGSTQLLQATHELIVLSTDLVKAVEGFRL